MIRLTCQLCSKNVSFTFEKKTKFIFQRLLCTSGIPSSDKGKIGKTLDKKSKIINVKFTSEALAATATSTPQSQIRKETEDSSKGILANKINHKQIKLLNTAVGVEETFNQEKFNFKNLPKYYLSLSKSRLTSLVVLTAMAGYTIAPSPIIGSSLAALTLGTALTSSSANCINQIIEISYDSQMDRTRNRVLVNNLISKQHAMIFASTCAITGTVILFAGCNAITALLGASNLLLYTCIYTPMKRISIANTWVGSVVGAIPPIMGWSACLGEVTMGALVLGAILYSWQFAHFNALSWNLRKDYTKAGYKMMSSENPDLCRRTALRYSIVCTAISALAPVMDVTTWLFAIDSLPVNLGLVYLSWKFYKNPDASTSRKLFKYSLIHLPLLIMLMLISKKSFSN